MADNVTNDDPMSERADTLLQKRLAGQEPEPPRADEPHVRRTRARRDARGYEIRG